MRDLSHAARSQARGRESARARREERGETSSWNGRRRNTRMMAMTQRRSAFVIAQRVLTIAAAATVVIVAVVAERAHAQGDEFTVFSTSNSIGSGMEDFVSTDNFAYVDIVGDVDEPGLAAASSESFAARVDDYTAASAFEGISSRMHSKERLRIHSDDGGDKSLQNLLGSFLPKTQKGSG
mmetsp:Transcript_1862/g.4200  ORF Transcript_1862/g.4200 Transcript_1862/m.4200 type:complete len:181 (+) Transcript_1862:50-592(+)